MFGALEEYVSGNQKVGSIKGEVSEVKREVRRGGHADGIEYTQAAASSTRTTRVGDIRVRKTERSLFFRWEDKKAVLVTKCK